MVFAACQSASPLFVPSNGVSGGIIAKCVHFLHNFKFTGLGLVVVALHNQQRVDANRFSTRLVARLPLILIIVALTPQDK